MVELFADQSTEDQLKTVGKKFLELMGAGDHDAVWDSLITPQAAKLIAVALLPVKAYQEGWIEQALDTESFRGQKITYAGAFTIGFQKDMHNLRSLFLGGIAKAMRLAGWFDVNLCAEHCWCFVDGSAAVLLDTSLKPPLLLPFIKGSDGAYRIDFEVFLLFTRQITPKVLYKVGEKALEVGQPQSAVALFELGASFGPAYRRMRQLILDHFLIGQAVTSERKEELDLDFTEAEKYIALARHQVLLLLSGPKVRDPMVDVGEFLRSTFSGYGEVPDVELGDGELEVLQNFDDSYLRHAVADILRGVNPVVAEREANKPHGPHEISDMELAVQHGDDVYRLSIVVKSGREITDDKVPVNVAYQLIRPFLYFPNGIVIFVTAKPCSQYLHNYIKQANDILGLSIEVIEAGELAKLLKVNRLLQKEEATSC